jgi:hypothetical protein
MSTQQTKGTGVFLTMPSSFENNSTPVPFTFLPRGYSSEQLDRWAGRATWIADTSNDLVHGVVNKLLAQFGQNVRFCVFKRRLHCGRRRGTTSTLWSFSNKLSKFIDVARLSYDTTCT